MKQKLSKLIIVLVLLATSAGAAAQGILVNSWTGNEDDLYLYHPHTKGTGVPVFIMPVHFCSSELGTGGKLQQASTWAAELVINSELLEGGLADYFDIYIYLHSESVCPVPTQGYVETFFEKYEKAKELYLQRAGGVDAGKVCIIYLGDGQVGGHANGYGGRGARLAWVPGAVNPENDYWTTHEFLGHAFIGLADEYETGVGNASNMVVSETQPNEDEVPWRDFFGYEESGGTTVGLYTYANPEYHGWRPYEYDFMVGNGGKPGGGLYVPMYHKWLAYQRVMEYAGYYKTLFDFCEFKGITLPKLAGLSKTEEDNLRAVAAAGGTYMLNEDFTLDKALSALLTVSGNFTLDLNGYTLAANNGINIVNGGTFTVMDSNPDSNQLRVYGGTSQTAIVTTGGTLIVNSGTVTATATDKDGNVMEGAAIGGVANGGSGGTVIINGGTVNAIGGHWSAGIGGSTNRAGCNLTINGGIVNVSRGATFGDANDIGQGSGGSAGTTIITGGSVYTKNNSITGFETALYPVKVTVKNENDNLVSGATVTVGTYTAVTGSNLTNDFTLGSVQEGVAYLWLEAGQAEITAQKGNDAGSDTLVVTAGANAIEILMYTVVPQTCDVLFESDGVVVADTNVLANTKINEPPTPTKTGFTFGGWYKEIECENSWNFASDIVSENITLYAKWTSATAVRSVANTGIKVSPNPATSGELTVEAGGTHSLIGKTAEIYSMSGMLVATYKIADEQTSIDISHLSNGMYLLKVDQYTVKFVKQ